MAILNSTVFAVFWALTYTTSEAQSFSYRDCSNKLVLLTSIWMGCLNNLRDKLPHDFYPLGRWDIQPGSNVESKLIVVSVIGNTCTSWLQDTIMLRYTAKSVGLSTATIYADSLTSSSSTGLVFSIWNWMSQRPRDSLVMHLATQDRGSSYIPSPPRARHSYPPYWDTDEGS